MLLCVQPGPKGEGGLDDATGQSGGAGGGAGYTQTSGTVELGKMRRGDEGDAFGMQAALAARDPAPAKGR